MTWIKNQLSKNLFDFVKTLILPLTAVILCWSLSFSMVKGFVVTYFIQFIVFYFLNSSTASRVATELEKENIKAIEMMNTNYVLVDCQACKGQNNVKVLISENNKFECIHCKAENKILLDLSVVLSTKIYNNKE